MTRRTSYGNFKLQLLNRAGYYLVINQINKSSMLQDPTDVKVGDVKRILSKGTSDSCGVVLQPREEYLLIGNIDKRWYEFIGNYSL